MFFFRPAAVTMLVHLIYFRRDIRNPRCLSDKYLTVVIFIKLSSNTLQQEENLSVLVLGLHG